MQPDSENRKWRSLADIVRPGAGNDIALLGAPLGRESITPGRCDLAPGVVRETLRRMSVYDLESGVDLGGAAIDDCGDLDVAPLMPAEALAPIRDGLKRVLAAHKFAVVLGGNNAITRPGVHALSDDIKRIGLLTLDAHFDLRDTDGGLNNGNPVRALLEDGLPGAHIVQIGLQPFANSKRMHETAKTAGIGVYTVADCRRQGILSVVDEALSRLDRHCEAIYADFDIDAIDRAQCPGAPGARPGGLAAHDFFAAVRAICAHPKLRAVDIVEFDPALDVANVTALAAARTIAEICAARFSR
jgi:formiminoglutamase